jgi:hypothetical protein
VLLDAYIDRAPDADTEVLEPGYLAATPIFDARS